MYILGIGMWFTKLIKQFFFWIDSIIYDGISRIYDLLIAIARTSIISQSDIAEMGDRIYKLLALFMIFKVTLSLITYIVNPDQFSDKSKGVSKLGANIVISLALLIITPYIFNYAYQLQTIILEDNSLATLVLGGSTEEEHSFFNSAGDDMAFITMSAFLSPNLSVGNLYECSNLIDTSTEKFNESCKNALYAQKNKNYFPEKTILNYINGVENNSLGLMFRQELIVATDSNNDYFIMDYRFIFSTVVGVVIVLILLTFCMDVAVRSIKLAFLQLVSPIPILSYIDPKSGKDGMFKKWYEMCFKTYLSLFIRLIALYFAVYIISKVADRKLVDIIDGSEQTNWLIAVFVIIGALMFAKQLPKILEGLGIKLDGGGKFFLNPFKKFEEETLGGKRVTGSAGGFAAGFIGGRGIGAVGGLARGFIGGKGYKGGLAAQADVNRKMREARIKGAGFWGSRFAGLSNRYGSDDFDLEGKATRLRKDKRAVELKRREVDSEVKNREVRKKALENRIAPSEIVIKKANDVKSSIDAMEKKTVGYIEAGKAGKYSTQYKKIKASYDTLSNNVGKTADIDHVNASGETIVRAGETITAAHVQAMQGEDQKYLNKIGRNKLMAELLTDTTGEVGDADKRIFNQLREDYAKAVTIYNDTLRANPSVDADSVEMIDIDASRTYTEAESKALFDKIHAQATDMEEESMEQARQIKEIQVDIENYNKEIKDIQATTTVQISGHSEPVTIEEAERILKDAETELKDTQDQRSLDRSLAKDRGFFNGSGK